MSIGDYILSGGEMAALTLLDACIRLLPGVMGAASSGDDESFETGLLEYPHYTRPTTWEGRTIPQVLRSGDHARIDAWRKAEAETITRLRRPDLWAAPRWRAGSVALWRAARRRDEVMNLIQTLEAEAIAHFNETKKIPEFRPGDTIKVGVKVVEGERTPRPGIRGRVHRARQPRHGFELHTVRKISFGEGVERVFPLYSPNVDSIDVVRRGVVRRAKLYYLRGRTGKSARIAERKDNREKVKA